MSASHDGREFFTAKLKRQVLIFTRNLISCVPLQSIAFLCLDFHETQSHVPTLFAQIIELISPNSDPQKSGKYGYKIYFRS